MVSAVNPRPSEDVPPLLVNARTFLSSIEDANMSTLPSPFKSVAKTDFAPSALVVMTCSVKFEPGVSLLFRNNRTVSSRIEATKMSTVPSPSTSVAYTASAPFALEVMSCVEKMGGDVSPLFRNSRTLLSFQEATKMSTVPSPFTSEA